MNRPFQLVDVFGDAPFRGNPLAVVSGAEGLDTDQMQLIARWLNLSETAFLSAPSMPDADYRVRIFTLQRELPFAGHPTLGACHAWLEGGGRPRDVGIIVQECGAGLIAIRREPAFNAFAAPPIVRGGVVEQALLAELAGVLRIRRDDILDAQWVDNGPGWVAIMLASADDVLALEPAGDHSRRLDVGVVGPYPPGAGFAFELRAFFSDQHGALREDPVTGSLNASVAQWLLASGRARAPYVAAQGARVGSAGRIHISQDEVGQVWVGGHCHTMVAGVLNQVWERDDEA
jgi:PhzF family phenazine biosynthesis protein